MMTYRPTQKHLLIGLGVLVLLALAAWVSLSNQTVPPEEAPLVEADATATSPDTVSGTPAPAKKGLPPELPFVLPAGATAIDDYAYIKDGFVYFRSVTGANPLQIPDTDGATFHRMQDFQYYPGQEVIGDCGASPIYTFYTDKNRPYFYQVWRAPEFRSSNIDAINGTKAEDFEITSATSATDGRIRFDIAYKVATDTCRLYLKQTLI